MKDLQTIADIKKSGNGKLADNIEYFVQGINFKKEIDSNIVDLHSGARSEVFASLFSYAIGEDDGDKNTLTKNFKNSFEVVKNYLKEYVDFK